MDEETLSPREDWIDRIARDFSHARCGSSVFMDGSHNPKPSERLAAQRIFDELNLYLREQIEREILGLFEYTETEAYQRAGFYYDRDDVMTAIASG